MHLPTLRLSWGVLSRTPQSAVDEHDAPDRVHTLTAQDMNKPAPLVFTHEVNQAIHNTVGVMPAETGGPLGGTRGSGVVEAYYHDDTSDRTAATYYPDFERLNQMFREEWNPAGINLLGVVHSHPRGVLRPSRPDAEYARRIMQGIPELDRFLLPIAQTEPDTGKFTMRAYAAVRDRHGVRIEDLDTVVLPVQELNGSSDTMSVFDRVEKSYDLRVMNRARIVAVGAGGSASFLEDMVRAGVGEIVLIDPDIVEQPNIATQQTYISDLGKAKVTAIAERLINISPTVRVWTIQTTLDDLNDAAVRRLASGWLPESVHPTPAATVLCAFTDNFEAQARVHRLGLHLGVPVVGGTVYEQGRGLEVTFAAAGVTRACIRCAQSSRYSAYLDQGFRNNVGSAGAPIWATSRLNALKQPIVLGLLHTQSKVADPGHPATQRYRRLLSSIENRNLVLASLDPDIHTTLGLTPFQQSAADGRVVGSDIETTLWREPVPDHPDNGYETCPDCGGTGDLSNSMGAFIDTTPMPRSFGDHRHQGKPKP